MPSRSDSRSLVAVEPVAGDVRAAVRRALEAIDFETVLPRGEPVSLKVNDLSVVSAARWARPASVTRVLTG